MVPALAELSQVLDGQYAFTMKHPTISPADATLTSHYIKAYNFFAVTANSWVSFNPLVPPEEYYASQRRSRRSGRLCMHFSLCCSAKTYHGRSAER